MNGHWPAHSTEITMKLSFIDVIIQPTLRTEIAAKFHRTTWTLVAHLWHRQSPCAHQFLKQAVGGRLPRYTPAPLLPLWAPKRLAPPSTPQCSSSSFPHPIRSHADCCSCVKAVPSKAAWWPWPFDLENGVRFTCDVGYLCANFGLPRPLFSTSAQCTWQRSDRQMSDKSTA